VDDQKAVEGSHVYWLALAVAFDKFLVKRAGAASAIQAIHSRIHMSASKRRQNRLSLNKYWTSLLHTAHHKQLKISLSTNMAPVNMFKTQVTQKELDLTLFEESSAWQDLTRHHPSPPPEATTSADQQESAQDQHEVAIQRQQAISPYLDHRKIKKYATKRSALFDARRKDVLQKVEQLSLRRDSAQDDAANPSTEASRSDVVMAGVEGKEMDDGQRLDVSISEHLRKSSLTSQHH